MRILYVCDEYPPKAHGGIGTLVHAMAHAMAAVGNDVTVLESGDANRVRWDTDVRVVSVRSARNWPLGGLLTRLRMTMYLRDAAVRKQLDIVELPDYGGLLPFRLPHCATVVRLQTSETGLARAEARSARLGIRLYECLQLRAHRRWIAVSEHVLRRTTEIFRITPDDVAVIHSPVPPSIEPTEAFALPGRYVLFAAARLTEHKGAVRVAKAMRRLLALHEDLWLVYAGDPTAADGIAVRGIREALGAELLERVLFLGRLSRPRLAYCMRRAAMLAFPSTEEAFPLVALEAMSMGTTVIASSEGPFREFIDDGETGVLIPARDCEALSNAMANLLDDPARCRAIGRRAAESVRERFSMDAFVTATREFYSRCLVAAGRPQRDGA